MKKNKLKENFFAELAKVPIVQVACEKTGVSRNSVYRWKKEDPTFAIEMEKALSEGVEFVNDMSESQILTLIKEKSFPALSFWLRHRSPKFKNRIEIEGSINTIQELSDEQKELVKNALTLADLTLKKHE